MSNLEYLHNLLEAEKLIRIREDKEVTVDYASVKAEIRIDCIEQIIKHWRKDG